MSERFKNTLAPSTLYAIGINYYSTGTISDRVTGKKLFDFYMTDGVSDKQKLALLAIAPDVQFKTVAPAYAPEIKRCAICFPKAAFYASKLAA